MESLYYWHIFILAYIYIIITENFVRGRYVGGLIIMLCAFALGYLSAIGIKALIKKMKGKEQEKTK